MFVMLFTQARQGKGQWRTRRCNNGDKQVKKKKDDVFCYCYPTNASLAVLQVPTGTLKYIPQNQLNQWREVPTVPPITSFPSSSCNAFSFAVTHVIHSDQKLYIHTPSSPTPPPLNIPTAGHRTS